MECLELIETWLLTGLARGDARQVHELLRWARTLRRELDPTRQVDQLYDGRGRYRGSVIDTGPRR